MKEWKTYKLGDLINIQSGGTPNKAVTAYWGGNIPWISAKTMYVDFITDSDIHITEEGLKNGSKLAPVGSILLLTRGSGLFNRIPVCLVKEAVAYNQDIKCITVKDNSITSNTFIFFWLYSQKELLSGILETTGIGAGKIDSGRLLDINVTLPDIETQNKFILLCSSIFEKIEINKQINDNLEQQASSLLSDWISTYPCRTYKLSDICKYANAKCETGNLTPQNYISTENMLPNKKGIVEASNIPTGKATCFKVDDILIANIRPYFQKIWKADINGGCSADVLCIRANIESHSPILYWLLHQDAFFEYVMTGAKGCKMPRGDKQHIMNWSIDLPEVQYWADLATQLGSIDQQIAYNRIESINLSNLRDTLLPKLMSGEIKINEIDC